jgi:hypothetical protein
MSRRAQIGIVSLVLTLIWTAVLFGMFIVGKVGQHPSMPLTLALSGALCAVFSGLLLTLACYPGLAELIRPVGQVAAIGATLEAIAVLWATLPNNPRIPDLFNELQFSNFLLLPSMLALLASGILWLARFFSNFASKWRFEPMGAVQSVFLLFRRHHRLLGWAGLAFAGAHSVYYTILPGSTLVQYTGYVATGALIVLGLIGLITTYNTFIRLWTHRILAIIMTVALILHWGPFLSTTLIMMVAMCVAGLIHVKLVGALARVVKATPAPPVAVPAAR